MPSRSRRLLARVCSIPTAPFAEQRVLAWIDDFARRRKMRLKQDRFGNRLIQIGPERGRRLVFVAHTDHPGLVAGRMAGPGRLLARFHGGVYADYAVGARVRFFGREEVTGVIQRITARSDRPNLPGEVEVKVKAAVEAGAPGMFDLTAGRVAGGRFHARVCDDLAGVAAILAAMDRLRRRSLKAPVAALLTRAEEEGFIGAIAAVKDGRLLRKSDRLISVECSAIQPYALQGDGVIVRVGDRTSIFNSAFTYWIDQQCESLAKDDPAFRHQRALMPGGSCEGTVFDAFGFTAAAACVPLGNYHNMDRQKKRIAPEFIDLRDWDSEVALFTRLGERAHEIDLGFGPLRKRLISRFGRMRRFL